VKVPNGPSEEQKRPSLRLPQRSDGSEPLSREGRLLAPLDPSSAPIGNERVAACVLLIGALRKGCAFYFIWLTQHLLRPLIESGVRAGEGDWLIRSVQKGSAVAFLPTRRTDSLCLGQFASLGLGLPSCGQPSPSPTHFLANNVAQKVVLDLRRRLYTHLQTMPPSFFEHERTGQLLARSRKRCRCAPVVGHNRD
jgi:hypothetical protein